MISQVLDARIVGPPISATMRSWIVPKGRLETGIPDWTVISGCDRGIPIYSGAPGVFDSGDTAVTAFRSWAAAETAAKPRAQKTISREAILEDRIIFLASRCSIDYGAHYGMKFFD